MSLVSGVNQDITYLPLVEFIIQFNHRIGIRMAIAEMLFVIRSLEFVYNPAFVQLILWVGSLLSQLAMLRLTLRLNLLVSITMFSEFSWDVLYMISQYTLKDDYRPTVWMISKSLFYCVVIYNISTNCESSSFFSYISHDIRRELEPILNKWINMVSVEENVSKEAPSNVGTTENISGNPESADARSIIEPIPNEYLLSILLKTVDMLSWTFDQVISLLNKFIELIETSPSVQKKATTYLTMKKPLKKVRFIYQQNYNKYYVTSLEFKNEAADNYQYLISIINKLSIITMFPIYLSFLTLTLIYIVEMYNSSIPISFFLMNYIVRILVKLLMEFILSNMIIEWISNLKLMRVILIAIYIITSFTASFIISSDYRYKQVDVSMGFLMVEVISRSLNSFPTFYIFESTYLFVDTNPSVDSESDPNYFGTLAKYENNLLAFRRDSSSYKYRSLIFQTCKVIFKCNIIFVILLVSIWYYYIKNSNK